MKVKYIYRPPWQGNFSFENIFNSVSNELKDQIAIEKYYCNSFFDIPSLFKMPFQQADIFHITGAVNYLALSLPPDSTLLTIHDIGYFENPVNTGFKKKIYEWLWLKLPLKRVAHITVVSEFTKKKVHSTFQIPLEKIAVIPNPMVYSFNFEPKTTVNEKLKIIQIGSGVHKNIKGLINAVSGLPVHLILVGKLNNDEKQLLANDKISFENHYNISKDFLTQLYKKSDLLYFASFYEGFGMPIIEAQALGRPVITSEFGAMKETSGGQALLVNPHDAKSIRTAILAVLNQTLDINNLLEEARKNAAKFEIKAIAQKYLELYRKIAHD